MLSLSNVHGSLDIALALAGTFDLVDQALLISSYFVV